VQEKYIDETKQGEAFAIAEKAENSKNYSWRATVVR
jgi:tRNA-2-methylthio-N6-dimethylallyladenosine synthase